MITVLAHQGGWDEVLWFLLPAALGWWAIRWANRRATEKAAAAESSEPDED